MVVVVCVCVCVWLCVCEQDTPLHTVQPLPPYPHPTQHTCTSNRPFANFHFSPSLPSLPPSRYAHPTR